ncbi:MAG: hypothetical protein V4719_02125 [Planctomycetota bacterium]
MSLRISLDVFAAESGIMEQLGLNAHVIDFGRRLWEVRLISGIALTLFLTGCGTPAEVRPNLFPAEGTLTINGKPAKGARVVLQLADGGSVDARGTRPSAKVEEDGRFQVATYQSGDGAPAGTYQLGIFWMNDENSSSAWDQLGGKFANPLTTKLTVVVKDSVSIFEPIQLTGVRLQTRRPPRKGNQAEPDE